MNLYSDEELAEILNQDIFHQISEAADRLGLECYVVGGYVRDIIMHRASNDMDFVTVGSGIEVAQAVADRIGRGEAHLSVFRTYGTAQVKTRQHELEFVGARRESYKSDSRNPVVEDGTLSDDQCRRDFTINAMAICLNANRYGELIDPFDGVGDIERRLIRTPRDPDITFSDDPLRMMRAVRFATQLNFDIYPETEQAIARNAQRMNIITRERISDELMKIMRSPTRLWLWNVQPCWSSQRLHTGLPMSCSSAAHRSHSLSLAAATLSSTCMVCRKLSLCARPFIMLTPFIAASSGKMSGSKPDWSSKAKPRDGCGERIIFISSSAMRSRVMMPMRLALRVMACIVLGKMSKSSCVANRTARIMRNGSSLNVMSGSSGVRMMRRARSPKPSNGSSNSP